MTDAVQRFYDEFASEYHLIFEDWEASIMRQAAVIGSILERECGPPAFHDSSGLRLWHWNANTRLAKLGFRVTGSDLSPRAVERARAEACARGFKVPLYVADMRELDAVPASAFDAVICMDNALPDLACDDDLEQAARQIRSKPRIGGTFIASIRDYDELLQQRPVVQGPGFLSESGRRRIVFQLWDWEDERRYTFHFYITRETPAGWSTFHGASAYRALRKPELTLILSRNGFANVHWLFPDESGYHQPVVVARAAGF